MYTEQYRPVVDWVVGRLTAYHTQQATLAALARLAGAGQTARRVFQCIPNPPCRCRFYYSLVSSTNCILNRPLLLAASLNNLPAAAVLAKPSQVVEAGLACPAPRVLAALAVALTRAGPALPAPQPALLAGWEATVQAESTQVDPVRPRLLPFFPCAC